MPSAGSSKALHAFVAYPAAPEELAQTIERAIEQSNSGSSHVHFRGWPESDIAGRPLNEPILGGITEAAFLIADITFLNFNVTYEIGFAIGASKRAVLVRNDQFEDEGHSVSRVGIFDTLGYLPYTNARSLSTHMNSSIDRNPIALSSQLDLKAPVYMLETPHRGDAMEHIVSCIRSARLLYRSFNPSEDSRLAAGDAIRHVASSHGVIVPLLTEEKVDAHIHNIRAAFVAGIAHALDKPTLILHHSKMNVPLDVRDATKSYRQIEEIDQHINDFALEVVASIQVSEPVHNRPQGTLANLDIGDPMAENELQRLDKYFLQRDEYTRTIRGDASLVVGRKGAGKTALFSQVRNSLRKDRLTVVVDLKPEGFQLVKLREIVAQYLSEGAKAHLLTTFWEYILLMEVAHKLLGSDQRRHVHDHQIFPHYRELSELFRDSPNSVQGDFSERLANLSSLVASESSEHSSEAGKQSLNSDEITQILRAGSLGSLRNAVGKYLEYKHGLWILFDNLDKGWTVPGPDETDILVLRCLIDAARKIQREMETVSHKVKCVVFVRNDVYQLLMDESPDFGKEMPVSLDWSDPEMLREMLRLRFIQNGYDSETAFAQVWANLCISHFKTEETSQFMIDRCLMRPRNLLKVFSHCKASAVNFRHERIEAKDIEKGMMDYSNDLLIEADLELTSIEPLARGLIYYFVGEHWKFSRDDLEIVFDDHELPRDKYEDVIRFFLYFGFFGIKVANKSPQFIFDVGYDMNRLEILIQKQQNTLEFTLNPAFWPALGVGPSERELLL